MDVNTVHQFAERLRLYSGTVLWVARQVGIQAAHPASPITESDERRIRAFMTAHWQQVSDHDYEYDVHNLYEVPRGVYDAHEVAQLWFTLPDLAGVVDVSQATVRQWIRRGKLAPVFSDQHGPLFALTDVAWRVRAAHAHDQRVAARPTTGPNPDELLTTAQAAQLCGVVPGTIRGWVHRGLLDPAATDRSGRHTFTVLSLAKAQAATMKHPATARTRERDERNRSPQ